MDSSFANSRNERISEDREPEDARRNEKTTAAPGLALASAVHPRETDVIPPPAAEVSRIALLVLVAAGVAGSLVASGDLASFSRGFAVGAGAALVLSRAKRPPVDLGRETGE